MRPHPFHIFRLASRGALRAAAVLAGMAYAAATVGGNLSSSPLAVKGTVPPNVMFSLSVEFPTADSSAYIGDTAYSTSTEYLGYFDPNKCYTYSSTGDGTDLTILPNPPPEAVTGRFEPHSITTTRTCTGVTAGGWSGNFLNWATMAAIDVFRYVMTGGLRSVDNTTETVLERTRIDKQAGTNNFPDKTLSGDTLIAGATPLALAPAGGGYKFRSNDIGVTLRYTTVTSNFGVFTDVLIRVKVCDTTIGLEENCRSYGTSPVIYKPAGIIQDNAERQKFGVFSYFASEDTDNAVMRSKSKFTGPTKFTSSGYTTNANTEWSSTTGIFNVNPDPSETSHTTYANSGVINYINKFGLFTQVTSRSDTESRYKVFDNVGRLYYETLNYLRGRQPTVDSGTGHSTSFYAGATTSNSDNFPIITSWNDPIEYSCQKNFIVFIGDTNSSCDKRFPGSTFTSNSYGGCDNGATSYHGVPTRKDFMESSGALIYGDTVNFKTYIDQVGTLEGRTLSTVSQSSHWLTGAAYWAKTQDIRPDDSTKPWTVGKQTVTSYMVDIWEFGDRKAVAGSESHFWLAAKYGGFKDTDGTNTPNLTSEWRVADSKYSGGGTVQTNPVTPYNGNTGLRPNNLLPAGDPRSMIDGIRAAVADINAQILDESALAQSTGDLRTTGGAFIFRSTFNSGSWIGDVQAFAVSASGAATTATWSAQTQVEAVAEASRKVLTYNDGRNADGTMGSATLNRRGIGFTWADLSPLQQARLNKDGVGFSDGDGNLRVPYLRGSRTNESPSGRLYRRREKLLGDIVNSSPVYVGNSPDQNILDASYNIFTGSLDLGSSVTYKNRLQVVYSGANDGMVHAFNAGPTGTLGAPLLSYVPAAVYSKLSLLTAGNYVHQYFVDGGPTAGDACLSTCASNGTNWRTMLVGGLNAGGKGIYALNITNPNAFAQPSAGNASSLVMWEFTNRDDADLGFTYGKPIIRKLNNGKWAVIFGNGYNNSVAATGDTVLCTSGTGTTADPFLPANCTTSHTGRAYLYIAIVDGPGAGTAWTQGTHYYKILAGPSSSTAYGTSAAPNGLGAPVAVDTNLDGVTDLVYAGDQKGNIWKFDLSSTNPASWGVSFSGAPLFTATSDTGVAQPITSQLAATRHPNGGLMIMFGTGSFIEDGDVATTGLQSMYGVWDQLIDNTTTVPTDYRTSKKLQRQKIVLTVPIGGEDFFAISNCKVNYTGLMTTTGVPTGAYDCPSAIVATGSPAVKQYGWYFDLYNVATDGTETKLGERFVADRPLLQAGLLTFPTLQPALDPCTGNTAGRRFDVDFLTGGRTDQIIFDTNNDGLANTSDMGTYVEGGVTKNIVLSGKFTSGGAADTPVRFTLPAPVVPPGSGSGAVSATGACTNFIAGWGCSGSSVAGINSSARTYVLDLTAKELATTSTVVNGLKIFLPGSSGRLGWRQIFQR